MLRNTTEAMAAILGGCNSISIHPFDIIFSDSNEFSRRISRNINNILKDESYFDKVDDPASGSYYIETLTNKLIEHALELFRDVEKKGGFIRQFQNGEIQHNIFRERDKKFENLSKRKSILVGTNQYPNVEERIDKDEIISLKKDLNETTLDKNILVENRGSKQFEKLRIATELYALKKGENKRPEVFLSLIGNNKVMRKARASFAWGFFGCAGFSIKESNPTDSLFKAVEKAIHSKADIVVICGSDEDYQSMAVDYAKAFKSNHKGILVIAGNPAEGKPEMINAGIDDFIHIRSDIIESLTGFQKKLKIFKS
jgi:methylmalonyl-CoA mutase